MNKTVLLLAQLMIIITLLSIIICLYNFLTTINGITLIGNNIAFSDLNQKILYVSILRSKLQFIKFLPIFTKSISHFSTLLITKEASFILSPRGKILYIIKLNHNDLIRLKYDQNEYVVTPDEEICAMDKRICFTKCESSPSVIEFAQYEKYLMDKNKYSFYGHNCQEITSKTIAHFNPNFQERYELGLKLLLRNITDILDVGQYL